MQVVQGATDLVSRGTIDKKGWLMHVVTKNDTFDYGRHTRCVYLGHLDELFDQLLSGLGPCSAHNLMGNPVTELQCCGR